MTWRDIRERLQHRLFHSGVLDFEIHQLFFTAAFRVDFDFLEILQVNEALPRAL